MWCIKNQFKSDFWYQIPGLASNTIKLQATLLFWLCVDSRGSSPLTVSNWTCSTDLSVIGSFGCWLYWESWTPWSSILCKYHMSTLALANSSWSRSWWPCGGHPGTWARREPSVTAFLEYWGTMMSAALVVDSVVCPYNSRGVSHKLPDQQVQGYVGCACQWNFSRSAS